MKRKISNNLHEYAVLIAEIYMENHTYDMLNDEFHYNRRELIFDLLKKEDECLFRKAYTSFLNHKDIIYNYEKLIQIQEFKIIKYQQEMNFIKMQYDIVMQLFNDVHKLTFSLMDEVCVCRDIIVCCVYWINDNIDTIIQSFPFLKDIYDLIIEINNYAKQYPTHCFYDSIKILVKGIFTIYMNITDSYNYVKTIFNNIKIQIYSEINNIQKYI